MIEDEDLVRDFILNVEMAIRHSRLDSIPKILKDASVVSIYGRSIDLMLMEGILTTMISVYDDIVKEMYPTLDELEELRSSISKELQTMAEAISAQEEKKVWNLLIGLPKLVLDLKVKMIYENRTKPETISVDFEVAKAKKRIYEEFMGKEDSDLLEEILAKLAEKIGRRS